MAKSESGRVVIELEPTLKRKLYSVLALESLTLKDWFIRAAESYVLDKTGQNTKGKNNKKGSEK